jgi:hypothetical protein
MDYKKIYDSICQRGKDQLEERKQLKMEGDYFEGHHIIPESMGGTGNSKNWNHFNIVPLTAREHFIAHWLLVRIYPEDNKLMYAFWGMCNQEGKNQKRYKPSSRIYQEARELCSKEISGDKNPMFGKTGDKCHLFGKKGDKHPMFGRTGEKNSMFGRTGEKNPMFGKGYLIAGDKNPMFGKTGDKCPSSKKIAQYSKDGKTLIKIYGSGMEAERETGTRQTNISRCCLGKAQSAGGSIWKHITEEQINNIA